MGLFDRWKKRDKKKELIVFKENLVSSINKKSSMKFIAEVIIQIKKINIELNLENEYDPHYINIYLVLYKKFAEYLRFIVSLSYRENFFAARKFSILVFKDVEDTKELLSADKKFNLFFPKIFKLKIIVDLINVEPKKYVLNQKEGLLISFFKQYFKFEDFKYIKAELSRRLHLTLEEFRLISLDYLVWKLHLFKELILILELLDSDSKWRLSDMKLKIEEEINYLNIFISVKNEFIAYVIKVLKIKSQILNILNGQYALHVSRSMKFSLGILKLGLKCKGGQYGANFVINNVPGGPPDAGIFIFRCKNIIEESINYKDTTITLTYNARTALKIINNEVIEFDSTVDFNKVFALSEYLQLNIESETLNYLKSIPVCVVNDYKTYEKELSKRGMGDKIKNLQDKGKFDYASEMASFLIKDRSGRAYLEKKFSSLI